MATYTLIPWDGGHANVASGAPRSAWPTGTPMTKLAPGRGPVRYSTDGVYRYHREGRCGWFVDHVPTDTDITAMTAGLGGWGSLADARRWTVGNPVPDGYVTAE